MPLVLRLFDAAGNQIKGDSKVPGYEGCIDLLEWSWVANFNPENLEYFDICGSQALQFLL